MAKVETINRPFRFRFLPSLCWLCLGLASEPHGWLFPSFPPRGTKCDPAAAFLTAAPPTFRDANWQILFHSNAAFIPCSRMGGGYGKAALGACIQTLPPRPPHTVRGSSCTIPVWILSLGAREFFCSCLFSLILPLAFLSSNNTLRSGLTQPSPS